MSRLQPRHIAGQVRHHPARPFEHLYVLSVSELHSCFIALFEEALEEDGREATA